MIRNNPVFTRGIGCLLMLSLSVLKVQAEDVCVEDMLCVYTQAHSDGYWVAFSAENKAAYDITVGFELALENLRVSGRKELQFVVPGNSAKSLFKLRPINDYKDTRYEYSYTLVKGNVDAEHDKDVLYQLPYEVGRSYYVSQSCEGRTSHSVDYSRHAIDFAMPEGSRIYAARGGKVIDLSEVSISGGTSTLHYSDANFVQLQHEDGSIGSYYHLRTMGVKVNIGDDIATGDFLGYSGSTGYASGPHLHFDVQVPVSANDVNSIPINWQAKRGVLSCPRSGLALKAVRIGS